MTARAASKQNVPLHKKMTPPTAIDSFNAPQSTLVSTMKHSNMIIAIASLNLNLVVHGNQKVKL